MCKLFSWIESEGKVYFLDDSIFGTEKSKKLFETLRNGIVGHGAIEAYFGITGIHREKNTYTDTYMLPKEIVTAFKDGKFKKILKYYDLEDLSSVLTSQAWKKYYEVVQQAREEYKKIEQPAWEKYKKIEQYNKAVQPAWEKYLEFTQSAFWKLFDDPNNRIECWR